MTTIKRLLVRPPADSCAGLLAGVDLDAVAVAVAVAAAAAGFWLISLLVAASSMWIWMLLLLLLNAVWFSPQRKWKPTLASSELSLDQKGVTGLGVDVGVKTA
ncbi:uncharacterized protein DMAD_13608 [Drosophila madeirensis]|uniref:Uncharacterized protein n=1 Tax=Drosophila madeirensis TaxID=30013 RepID=A0AAU9GCX2_DROMD